MAGYDEPSAAQRARDVSDPVAEADLERVLQDVPRGALALCGLALGILIVCWLAIYLGVFIPRGPVG